MSGVRVLPDIQSRDKPTFGFMSNEVSSERRVETAVARVAQQMRDTRAQGGRIAFVAGPVIIHTGGTDYFCELIRLGYVNLLLSGNALAVHDIEYALSGTSLGIDLNSGHPVEHGHRNHMRAINTIRRAGGIASAVASGVAAVGRDARLSRHTVRVSARRIDQRRRSAAGDDHGSGRGAGPLRGGTFRRDHGRHAVVDAAQHRRRQHAALVGAGRVRRHQPGGGHQARGSRIDPDHRHRDGRRAVSPSAGGSAAEIERDTEQ